MSTSSLYDLIIVGGGPAGLTAGIYAGRAKMKTLILDKDRVGGQIKITADIANYPGVVNATGPELVEGMRRQALNFGVQFASGDVTGVDLAGDIKKIHTENGDYEALSVIVATGARPRTLGFIGEDEFRGRGVGYCATCDGEFFAELDIFVVGGGYSAAEEAIYLTRFAKKVHVIVREPAFTCAPAIGDKVLAHPGIQVHFHTEITEIGGDSVLRYAKFYNNETGENWEYRAAPPDSTFGVFVFVGYEPMSEPFAGILTADQWGYLLTDEDMQTNLPGVYAAGDIRPKRLRQLVTATADGAMAATAAEKYVEHQREMLGIHSAQGEEAVAAPAEDFFDDELRGQLAPILERFEKTVQIRALLDDSPLSVEIRGFLEGFASMTQKVSVQYDYSAKEAGFESELVPGFAVFNQDGEDTGIRYHGVPGGHEFNSFILALYNTAGPGQSLEEAQLALIRRIEKPVNITVAASLSCTLCPDVVALTQLMAVKNPNITAEMVDISKFPQVKSRFNIMSVPAIILDQQSISFGKKNLEELVGLIEKHQN